MKIYIIRATPSLASGYDQADRIQYLWQLSDKSHSLTDNPFAADLIMVCNIAGPNWFFGLRNNHVVNKYPEKSFAISDSDISMPLLHGIYTSAGRSLLFKQRFRTAAYNLYPDDYLNSHIRFHPGNSYAITKRYLGSFMGRDSDIVREKIFNLKDKNELYIYNTTREFAAFGKSPQDKSIWRKKYTDILESSKFAICPRGVGAASMRLFESMKMGVAPIILADNWIYPKGPDWNSFALIVKEADADRLYEIMKSHEDEYMERGRLSNEAYRAYFSETNYFNYLVLQMIDIKSKQMVAEKLFWLCRNLTVAYWKISKRHLRR